MLAGFIAFGVGKLTKHKGITMLAEAFMNTACLQLDDFQKVTNEKTTTETASDTAHDNIINNLMAKIEHAVYEFPEEAEFTAKNFLEEGILEEMIA